MLDWETGAEGGGERERGTERKRQRGGVNEATYTTLTSLHRLVKTADCYLTSKFFTKSFTTFETLSFMNHSSKIEDHVMTRMMHPTGAL